MIRIRDYQKRDYEATKDLMKQLLKLYRTDFDEKSWQLTLRHREFSPQQRTLLAENNGNIVGMCFVDVKWNEIGIIIGSIGNVIVEESQRERGIATELMNKAIDILTEMNVDKIKINVNLQVQDHAIPLFEKMGFSPEYIAMTRTIKKVR
ncbi:MAG: GNAT family N-acetyltransferase [Promethearchaeota archaeon]|nr:MAG: GNAT family N-acetyltransferase [Candidatus Lokiarchaeota archaeon]